ncbi:GntR family transcriptional regulator [Ideonella livida]|uniref:GntR family transcriptional regulator n=1 Tax=Ideonella livida TaxID=2707176 RepID=A0A7C9PKX6_9BURK|nr:GntR family transcriptional regulator [Ideonella livida]NDY93950.1 GntR family transcriptional regulator [Ideonella livida]
MSSPPVPLRAQAYESFQQQILQANIRPGQFVSQRELMQLLDMPLGAVRELIPRLEAEGLLRTVPQRGLQIAHVDLALINNAFHLRLVLEREAAMRFAQSATDAELAAIEATHLDLLARAEADSTSQSLLTEAQAVDWGLHDRMIDALGNPLISEVYRINTLRVRLIRLERAMLSDDALAPALREHLWFIRALRAREVAAVSQRLTHHLESAHQRILGLPRPPLPPDWMAPAAPGGA